MNTPRFEDLNIKIFFDGANIEQILAMNQHPYVHGITTNPSLMHQAGIKNYRAFAFELLEYIKEKPISFEIIADDFLEMEAQARELASWADNVYVKIPITNTRNQSSLALIQKLGQDGIKMNITALMSYSQISKLVPFLPSQTPSIISIFAGRIADTGRDPMPTIQAAVNLLKNHPNAQVLWASSREFFNLFQAEACQCQLITMNQAMISKISQIGYDLEQFSLDTVKMFYQDALQAGLELKTKYPINE
jgi:transaldolase